MPSLWKSDPYVTSSACLRSSEWLLEENLMWNGWRRNGYAPLSNQSLFQRITDVRSVERYYFTFLLFGSFVDMIPTAWNYLSNVKTLSNKVRNWIELKGKVGNFCEISESRNPLMTREIWSEWCSQSEMRTENISQLSWSLVELVTSGIDIVRPNYDIFIGRSRHFIDSLKLGSLFLEYEQRQATEVTRRGFHDY